MARKVSDASNNRVCCGLFAQIYSCANSDYSSDAVFLAAGAFLAGFFAAGFLAAGFFAAGFLAAAFFLAGAFFLLPDFAAFSAISSTANSMVTSSGSVPLGSVALIFSHFT